METSPNQMTNQMLSESPPFLQTRCPNCQKLFAIEALPPSDANEAIFECSGCLTKFTIELEPAAEESDTRAAAQQIADELALGARPELILLWKKVIDEYQDDFNHDSFLQACTTLHALRYAAHKYSRILKEFPGEETAKKMTARIEAIAAREIEAIRASRKAPRMPSLATGDATHFLISRLSLVGILLATCLTVFGSLTPGMNLTGIGLSMMALILGIRLVSRRASV